MERKPSVVKLVSWGASMVSLERGYFGSNRCEHKAGTTDTGRARGASISRTLNSCLFFRSSTFEKLGMSELGNSTRRMVLLSNFYSSVAPASTRRKAKRRPPNQTKKRPFCISAALPGSKFGVAGSASGGTPLAAGRANFFRTWKFFRPTKSEAFDSSD